jgi:hypothetical protein
MKKTNSILVARTGSMGSLKVARPAYSMYTGISSVPGFTKETLKYN